MDGMNTVRHRSDLGGRVGERAGAAGAADAAAGQEWTAERMKALLLEVVEIYVRLPDHDRPAGYRSCMPAVIRNAWEAFNPEARPVTPGPPRPDVDQKRLLGLVEGWLRRLPMPWYRICWMRAMHDAGLIRYGWRKIGAEVGMAGETARYKYGFAIKRLCEIANGGGISERELPLFI